MRGSISTAVQCFAFSNIRTVRFPVPGPTSSTLSVGRRLACMTKNKFHIGIVEKGVFLKKNLLYDSKGVYLSLFTYH